MESVATAVASAVTVASSSPSASSEVSELNGDVDRRRLHRFTPTRDTAPLLLSSTLRSVDSIERGALGVTLHDESNCRIQVLECAEACPLDCIQRSPTER